MSHTSPCPPKKKKKERDMVWISFTHSSINSMLLWKTPGGSSFIQLLSNSLRKDIPWILLKLYHLLCVAAIAHFLRSKYNLLVPCLGQINIYRLVSLTFCVALDYFFVVYTFRFCVASKNVRCKTQLLTPPSLYTWIISISPLMSFLPQSLMREPFLFGALKALKQSSS